MKTQTNIRKAITLWVVSAVLAATLASATPSAATMVRVIVQGTSVDDAAAAVRATNGRLIAQVSIIQAVVAEVPQSQLPRLAAMPGVIRVTPNRTVRKAGGVADVEFAKAIGAAEVWATGNLGAGVTLAVLDSGIETTFLTLHKSPGGGNHNRILAYYDVPSGQLYESPDLLSSPGDPNGHGTHVAGIIGNSFYEQKDGEYQGVAPAADLVAVRVLDETGVGTYADVIQGIDWVVQHKDTYNIRVLNISMYAPVYAPYWADPYNLAVMAAWQAGIVVVASAGNAGPAPMSIGVPGNTPYIITVGAFTDNYSPKDFGDDYIPPFSSTGPTLDAFVKPDLIAPGAHIVSLMKRNAYLSDQHSDNYVNGHYFSMAGTSMSAAVVSGIVGLMLSQHPELTPDQVKYRLVATARPQFSEYSGLAAYSVWEQGAGRVWAPDAVFTDLAGEANHGMDIGLDLAGVQHYEGWTTYDLATGQFVIRDDGFNSWAGGFNSWAGGFNSWAGGYDSWAGGPTNWAGGFNSWAGGYSSWAGGFNSWAGGYSSWAGGFNSWAGGFNSWAGSAGDPAWAASFASLSNLPAGTSTVGINNWVNEH
ncbi:MAG: S8 family serine peptidase [Thermoflexales bacterium]|nr:S8 family serine peptidase [Thermoflexales bacterium]